MLLSRISKTNIYLMALISAMTILCSLNICCRRSLCINYAIHIPPPPTYNSSLTNEDIDYLLAGSEDSQVNLIAWSWVEEIIRHGNEPRVKIALNNASAPNQRYMVQANFALFYLNDNPSSRFTAIIDMLINGTEIEKSKIRFLLPFLLSRESDAQYIPRTLELLTNEDPLVRETVLQIIPNFPDVPGVIESIFESSYDTNAGVRNEVGSALCILASRDPLSLKNQMGQRALSQLILHDDWQGGKAGAYSAAAYCLDDPVISSLLTERLQQECDPGTRAYILGCLHDFAPKRLALPLLRLGLNDPDPLVRHEAEDALGYTKFREYTNVVGLVFIVIILAAITALILRRWNQKVIRNGLAS